MGWRGYVYEEGKTVFFWSQKAACTSLFSFLAENLAEPPQDKKHFHTASLPFNKCRPRLEDEGYRSVILVRHPVNRIISAYFNKFCIYRGQPLKTRDDLESFAKDLHDLYGRRRGEVLHRNVMSFEQFLNTVEALHNKRPKPTQPVNGHWETQMPPFLAEEGFRYDEILHVENMEAELVDLAARLGMTYRPRTANRTELAQTRHQGYLGDRPAREVAEMDFGYENFISPETLAQIMRIYRVDFEAFGYPLEA